jgi:hypothetical protein
VQRTDVLTRPQLSIGAPRLRLRRWILVTVGIAAVLAFGLHRGLLPEYQCSPGYREVAAPITGHLGVCLDHDNKCVPAPHTDRDSPQNFTLPSCVAVHRG